MGKGEEGLILFMVCDKMLEFCLFEASLGEKSLSVILKEKEG
jgi:hypothetical protein